MLKAVASTHDPRGSGPGKGTDQARGGVKTDFAAALLAFEARVREIDDEAELMFSLCNDARRFAPFRQAFALQRHGPGRFHVKAASSLSAVDRDAPLIRWIEKIVARLAQDVDISEQHFFSLPSYCDESDEEAASYPFPAFLWTPLKDGERTVGGFLTAREAPWDEGDRAVAARCGALYAHAWRSLKGRDKIIRKRIVTPKRLAACAVALLAAALWPVSITALAPVEVVPLKPLVVTAPIDGVVKEILPEPGEAVEAGATVVTFEDLQYRNEFAVADQNEAVAEARYLRASQGAINDFQDKRDVEIAKAEFELAKAERAFAADVLEKTDVKAVQSGLAVYSDRRDWVGRPVAAGEAILQIADPSLVRFAIDLPVKESLVLKDGAPVKVFLDSDPLNPLEAMLVETGYKSRPDERDVLSYRLYATLKASGEEPRIGLQGMAKVHGDKAPLIYVLLRRPLGALRQLTGW